LRFASLGSGSRGNGLLVEEDSTCLLIDCGFSEKETRRRLQRLGREPASVTAILVTHEHGDHIRGVERFSRLHSIPVWMTHGTREQWGCDPGDVHFINGQGVLDFGDLQAEPIAVPHDAREPVQFVIGNGDTRLGVLTDTGSITPHIVDRLDGCHALVLECNHDYTMLFEGGYPEHLKARVGGDFGHLSNDQAASLLGQLDCTRLQTLVAAHLSEKNNTPDHARRALAASLGCEEEWVIVADQEAGFPWQAIY
jgi:phosphoribosyl 1,2-cyclic phosphodiesterase